MGKNIVLLPCWRRDDFLKVTLDCILAANGSDKYCYVFLLDRNFYPSVEEVISQFPLCKEIRKTPFHRFHGNSYNVLEGYKWSLEAAKTCDSSLIFLLEEDIAITKDFYDFHEKVQSQFNSFCVSACRNQNENTKREPDPSAVYHHQSFQSLGLSWKPENLRKVVEHANMGYYRNPRGYLRQHFPNSSRKDGNIEQDGVIIRICEKDKVQTLYCNVPRCYHFGWIGYNRRGVPLNGSLSERVEKIKHMTAEDMNALALDYKDLTPIDLTIDHKVDTFHLVP